MFVQLYSFQTSLKIVVTVIQFSNLNSYAGYTDYTFLPCFEKME